MPSDANALALWVAKDAISGGGTVTIPNRVGGGASMVGASATISPTYMRKGMPAIVGGCSANVNLSAYKAVTIYVACYGGGTTSGYLFAHGVATTRLNAIYNRGNAAYSLTDVRVSMVGASGESLYVARHLSGGSQAAPCVYCFTFDTAGGVNVGQPIDNPRIDGSIATFIDFGQVAQNGFLTNSALHVCEDTSGGNVFDGGWAAVYIRHGAHTVAERRTWTNYLHYFLGTYNIKQINLLGHSIFFGSNGNTGGARKGAHTAMLADANARPFRFVGHFSTTPSPAFVQDYCTAASGWRYDDMAVYIPPGMGPFDATNSAQIGKYYPDILAILGASNNLFDSGDLDAIQADLDAIVDGAVAKNPNLCVGIFHEAIRTDFPTVGARVVSWNARIASIVASMRARHINARECTAFIDGAPALSDQLHPVDGATGYDKIAPFLYADLQALCALHDAGPP